MKDKKLKGLVVGGVIAAAYTALSLALAPLTFGPVQFRIAEALTLLPVLYPPAVWGVALGCAITNAVGSATGANFLGIADVFFGTAATLISALLTARLGSRRFKGLPLLSSLPPVLVNGLVIGAEWCYAMKGTLSTPVFFLLAGQIALGQLLPCCVIGVLMIKMLERRNICL